MGGVHYQGARAANVQQELQWLGIPKKQHASTVAQYRAIEREALTIYHQRASKP